MISADELERRHTLSTAVARFDALRTRESLAGAAAELAGSGGGSFSGALSLGETLELLALGAVITRKAGYGRQLSVRAARESGASWTDIGTALGISKQSAWEAQNRWIEDQEAQHRRLD